MRFLSGGVAQDLLLVAPARLAGFVIINVALGIIVYVLFRKAGIIGGGFGGTPPDTKATTPGHHPGCPWMLSWRTENAREKEIPASAG